MAEEEKPRDDFVQPSTLDLIDRAEAAAKKLELENLKSIEIAKRIEELEARRMLSGRSEAGIIPKEISKEDKIKEEVNQMFRNKAGPFVKK